MYTFTSSRNNVQAITADVVVVVAVVKIPAGLILFWLYL